MLLFRNCNLSIVITLLLFLFVYCEEEDDYISDYEEIEEFIPTKEWQEVKRGQSIPAGLHVRMNLQTGLREAKLMEEEEEDEVDNASVKNVVINRQEETNRENEDGMPYGTSDRRGVVNKKTKVFSAGELNEMLQNLNSDSENQVQRIASDTSHSTNSHSTISHSSSTRRTGSKDNKHIINKSAKDLPITFHRDVEVMMNLSRVLADNSSNVTELCRALEEMEYYVHQIDNARDLNVIGGLVLVVRLLNHTHPDVRSWAAHVLGSASQSNPTVQRETLDYGALKLLSSLLAATQPDLVQRRALFALSALLRGNLQEQLQFIRDHHGLEELGQTFMARSNAVRLKAVVLLTDLLNNELTGTGNSSGVHQLELSALVHSNVLSSGWCTNVPELTRVGHELSGIEKGLLAMELLVSTCGFAGEVGPLQELEEWLKTNIRNQDSDFSQVILERCQALLRAIRAYNSEL